MMKKYPMDRYEEMGSRVRFGRDEIILVTTIGRPPATEHNTSFELQLV
jgi:hypothetical protein